MPKTDNATGKKADGGEDCGMSVGPTLAERKARSSIPREAMLFKILQEIRRDGGATEQFRTGSSNKSASLPVKQSVPCNDVIWP